MRKFIPFLLFINSISLSGQIQSGWGPLYKNSVPFSKHMWISSEDSVNSYFIKRRYILATQTWYLEAINKKTKKITFLRALMPPLDNEKKKTKIGNVICLGDKLYLLTKGTKKDEIALYATSINKITGVKEETKIVYSQKTQNADKEIKFAISPDRRKILIYPAPYDGMQEEMKLMNINFEKIWTDKLAFDYVKEVSTNINVAIDNSGNIIIHSSIAQMLTVFSTGTSEGKDIKIAIPDGMINYSSAIRIAPNGDAYLLLLLRPAKYNLTCGFIHSFIDLNEKKVKVSNTTFLDSVQLKEILGKNIGYKWKEYGVYYVKDIFFRQNDIVLIGEQCFYKVFSSPIGFNNSFPSITNYSFLGYNQHGWANSLTRTTIIEEGRNLVSVFNVAFSGDVNWVKMIPKNQLHPNENYLSYIASFNEKGVYLIYNDNPDNVNQKKEFGPVRLDHPKRGLAVLAFVDNGGQLNVKEFGRTMKYNGLILKPGLSFIGNNSIFIFSERKNFFSLGEWFID